MAFNPREITKSTERKKPTVKSVIALLAIVVITVVISMLQQTVKEIKVSSEGSVKTEIVLSEENAKELQTILKDLDRVRNLKITNPTYKVKIKYNFKTKPVNYSVFKDDKGKVIVREDKKDNYYTTKDSKRLMSLLSKAK